MQPDETVADLFACLSWPRYDRDITPADTTTPTTTDGLLRGRFAEATDQFVEQFTASVGFDRRLYQEDIAGSIAHTDTGEDLSIEQGRMAASSMA